MMCNTNKLAGTMREKGFTQEKLAQQINMSRATLARRMNKSEEFTIGEIESIARALNLTGEEAIDIFFCANSLIHETKEPEGAA